MKEFFSINFETLSAWLIKIGFGGIVTYITFFFKGWEGRFAEFGKRLSALEKSFAGFGQTTAVDIAILKTNSTHTTEQISEMKEDLKTIKSTLQSILLK